MAKKGNRTWVWMEAEDKKESTHRFQTERNKVNIEGPLKIKKYDPTVKRVVAFKESKKK